VIKDSYEKYRTCAEYLEDIIQKEYGMEISHNKIQNYIRRLDMASETKKKQEKRKWVRWERNHSMSLWHLE